MVVLAVAFGQLRLKVAADLAEDVLQVADCRLGQHVAPVFRDKDQMDMKHVEYMSSCSVIHSCAPQTKC